MFLIFLISNNIFLMKFLMKHFVCPNLLFCGRNFTLEG